jgi:hypothetical protein
MQLPIAVLLAGGGEGVPSSPKRRMALLSALPTNNQSRLLFASVS